MYGLGIDIGSTASKVAIADEGRNLVGSSICSLGAGTSGAVKALSMAFEQAGLDWNDMACSVATGYGRQRFDRADKQISEISCHAKGVDLLLPGSAPSSTSGARMPRPCAFSRTARLKSS